MDGLAGEADARLRRDPAEFGGGVRAGDGRAEGVGDFGQDRERGPGADTAAAGDDDVVLVQSGVRGARVPAGSTAMLWSAGSTGCGSGTAASGLTVMTGTPRTTLDSTK
jgi:hypothetical protein